MYKKLLLLMLLLPLVSAVTLEKETQIHESETGGAIIQVWQDTVADVWQANETYGGIIINNLKTFNSTFINKNLTNPSKMKFIDMNSVTVFYTNGTHHTYSGTNFVLSITIPAAANATLATDVPPTQPSTTIYIKPDYENAVPHIILGRRIIFTWLNFII